MILPQTPAIPLKVIKPGFRRGKDAEGYYGLINTLIVFKCQTRKDKGAKDYKIDNPLPLFVALFNDRF
jgi:hypothetical protein